MSWTRREMVAMTLGAMAASAAPLSASPVDGGGFMRAKGKSLIGPDGKPLLLRGTNLGNWLEPEGYMFLFQKGPTSAREIDDFFSELIGPDETEDFWRQYRKRYITPADIAFLQRCGFNSLRIPLHHRFFADAEGFELLEPIIAACREAKILVILDMHCAPGGQTGTNIDDSHSYPWLFESERSQQKLIDVWKRIATHYRDEPTILAYDLLNEPIPHFARLQVYNDKLEPLYKRVTAAIREVDRNHVIMLGGAQWDSNFKVFGPPFDENLVYQFHKYWVPPDQHAVQEYVDFRERYNVPVWLGESGENTDDWVRKYRTVLEKNDIGWCFWPYKKMVKTSCILSVQQPQGWDQVVRFAAMPPLTESAEKRIATRPSVAESRAAMNGLLENLSVERCKVNAGYLQALGLKAGSI